MSLAFRTPMTIAEFLAWEDRQPLRYEFDGVRAVAMTGGTASHARIQRNLALALGLRLRGRRWEFLGSDLKIEVDGRIRYPDGFVACSPVAGGDKVVRNPVVIFEVLGDITPSVDFTTKNREYAATPSVQRYVILSQDERGGIMFERVGDDWAGHLLRADGILNMPEIDIEVPLAEFYEGVFAAGDETTSAASP